MRIFHCFAASEYIEKRYHQFADEYDGETWDFGGIVEDAQLLFTVGYRLADSDLWPNWSDDSEFRAARDKSADQRQGAPVPDGRGRD